MHRRFFRLRVPVAFGSGAFIGAIASWGIAQSGTSEERGASPVSVARPSLPIQIDSSSDESPTPSIQGPLADAVPHALYRRISQSPCGDGFATDFDGATRNPRWVAERLTSDGVWHSRLGGSGGVSAARAETSFREDAALPPHLRSRLAAYAGSGWDRGHLAAAANHPPPSQPAEGSGRKEVPAKGGAATNHPTLSHTAEGSKSGEGEVAVAATVMRDSFLLSNVSPQAGEGFNRGAWARLEAWVRNLLPHHGATAEDGGADIVDPKGTRAPAAFDEVLVCTGPLWVPARVPERQGEAEAGWRQGYPVLGGPLAWVAVPTHFYKVVLARRLASATSADDEGEEEGSGGGGGEEWAVGAFILPNAPLPSSKGRPFRPADYAVPLLAAEALAGLEVSFRECVQNGWGWGCGGRRQCAVGPGLLEGSSKQAELHR